MDEQFFRWLNTLFGKTTPEPPPPCTHEKVIGSFTIVVRGETFVRLSDQRCPACALAFAEHYAITCAACRKPILPGIPVGRSGQRRHQYVHTDWECMGSGVQYCGVWGEGQLITLHELNPEKYPAGTTALGDHIMNQPSTHVDTIP